jgi:hypothetical protein
MAFSIFAGESLAICYNNPNQLSLTARVIKFMTQKERYCPSCQRIYELGDWTEPDCPFCEVALIEVGGSPHRLSPVISTEIAWPTGEKEEQVAVINGYLSAQLTKAQLESAGIPVLLQANNIDSIYPVAIGPMSEVRVYVPRSMAAAALVVLREIKHG